MRLDDREQRNVRTALLYLRFRVGGWAPLAGALDMKANSIAKVAHARRHVTAKIAFGVARLVEVSIDALLAGTAHEAKLCRYCGRPQNDFPDEETLFEQRVRGDPDVK